MTTFYFLKEGIKLVPSQSVAILDKKMVELNEVECKVLALLSRRPLFEQDLKSLPKTFSSTYLESSSFKIAKNKFESPPGIEFIKCKRTQASVWRLQVLSKVSIYWFDFILVLRPGFYSLNFYLPDRIEGDYLATYYRRPASYEVRDKWILNYIHKSGFTNVLELGCGKEKRLGHKILNLNSKINYIGQDKELRPDRHFIRANILKTLPRMKAHLVIAQEVLEHLPENKLIPLILKIFINKAEVAIFTTPNREYNSFLNVKSRHIDHYFEWNKAELKEWIRKLKLKLDCTVRIVKLGRQIEGVAPTWGIIIKRY